MSFEISPEVLAAFEASAEQQERRRFVGWWNGRSAILGAPLTPESAESFWVQAVEAALQIGIVDNEDDRIFAQAAAIRLMPQPSGEQWLLATDAIFLDAPLDERLNILVEISKRRAH